MRTFYAKQKTIQSEWTHWTNARTEGKNLIENQIIAEKKKKQEFSAAKRLSKKISNNSKNNIWVLFPSVIGYKVAQNVAYKQEISQNEYLD